MTDSEFESYARRYSDTIFRVALNILKNKEDSEDALQNTLIRFYKSSHKLSGEEHIKAWLIRVAQNEAKRIFRKNRRCDTSSLGEWVGEAFSDDLEKKELFLSLMSLDEKYSTALYLHYYEGYKTEEIAKMTSASPSTVRSRLSRGRELLKNLLSEDDYESD
ncbi:MAG: sigma-70 family RNA polymerase sigma factor [Ruminococcus sp.]|nr:sigma-70 family RNA polymerase sigma factor [Ruminococcus sp.]